MILVKAGCEVVKALHVPVPGLSVSLYLFRGAPVGTRVLPHDSSVDLLSCGMSRWKREAVVSSEGINDTDSCGLNISRGVHTQYSPRTPACRYAQIVEDMDDKRPISQEFKRSARACAGRGLFAKLPRSGPRRISLLELQRHFLWLRGCAAYAQRCPVPQCGCLITHARLIPDGKHYRSAVQEQASACKVVL